MDTSFTGCIPVLTVSDVAASKRFYLERLGFSLDFEWGSPTHYVGLSRDSVCIHLISEDHSRQAAGKATISLMATEVDEYFKACQKMQVDIVVPTDDRPYGLRDFALRDPDGNVITIGCEIQDR